MLGVPKPFKSYKLAIKTQKSFKMQRAALMTGSGKWTKWETLQNDYSRTRDLFEILSEDQFDGPMPVKLVFSFNYLKQLWKISRTFFSDSRLELEIWEEVTSHANWLKRPFSWLDKNSIFLQALVQLYSRFPFSAKVCATGLWFSV